MDQSLGNNLKKTTRLLLSGVAGPAMRIMELHAGRLREEGQKKLMVLGFWLVLYGFLGVFYIWFSRIFLWFSRVVYMVSSYPLVGF